MSYGELFIFASRIDDGVLAGMVPAARFCPADEVICPADHPSPANVSPENQDAQPGQLPFKLWATNILTASAIAKRNDRKKDKKKPFLIQPTKCGELKKAFI